MTTARTAHAAVYDTLADWEVGHLAAELRTAASPTLTIAPASEFASPGSSDEGARRRAVAKLSRSSSSVTFASTRVRVDRSRRRRRRIFESLAELADRYLAGEANARSASENVSKCLRSVKRVRMRWWRPAQRPC
jgi:hypothetical protein